MVPLHVLLKQKSIRIRTLQNFVAANPWIPIKQEHWSLELFRMVIHPGKNAELPEVPIEVGLETNSAVEVPLHMKSGELLGLRSDSDGSIYMLPYSLIQCYQRREISMVALPEMLYRLGPVRKYDFMSPLRNKVVIGLATFLICMFLGIQGCILNELHAGKMHIQQGLSIWHITLLISPILMFGCVFLWIGVSRLRRNARQTKIIRAGLQGF